MKDKRKRPPPVAPPPDISMRLSQNERKYLHSFSQKKIRQLEKKFVLEGWRALREALESGSTIEIVVVQSRYLQDPDYRKILNEIRARRIPLKEGSELEFQKIADTVHSQGVVALVHQQEYHLHGQAFKHGPLLVALDAVADPGNLGSVLRSAAWFGVNGVLLGKGSVERYNEKVVRSTVGSLFYLPVVEGVDLAEALPLLKKEGFMIVATSGDAPSSYADLPRRAKLVVVFGSEAHGVAKEIQKEAEMIVKIPRYGNAESLNLGVACGIMLAHIRENKIVP
jgi:TrmH family RNA methyltransferase